MNQKIFNKIVEKSSVYRGKYPNRDNDGDGVKNILDCQPNNPKKQGFIHDITKAGVKKFKSVRKERAEIKAIERDAFKAEKRVVAIETGKRKARTKADRKAEIITRAKARGVAKARRKERFIAGAKKFGASSIKFVDKQTKSSSRSRRRSSPRKAFDINKIDLGF